MAFSWFFPQEAIDHKTPSRAHGIPLTVETRYRKEGAKLVINAANALKLRYDTVATGVVFYHRFFMMQSFKEFNRWVVAGACLLLAGKVEETPKQCKVILKEIKSLLSDQQWAGFGRNPKEELLTHERILLQTIKFDLQIDHPYSFILKFAKELKGDKAVIEKLVQAAWTFVNDSLVTTLSIQWEPASVAVAFIYLAGKLTKYDLQGKSGSKTRAWWRQFVDTLDEHDLDSICHQVLDIYQESGKDTSDDQQSDDEPISQSNKPSQSVATPTPTSAGTNGQLPPIPPPVIQTTPSTLAPPTTWTAPTLTNTLRQLQSALPNNAQYQQTLATIMPQPGVGLTTYALGNPLQSLQNFQSAVSQSGAAQMQFTPTQQLPYPGTTTLQAPAQNLVAPLVQPGTGLAGVYPQQYQTTRPAYQPQIKTQQQPFALLGQPGAIQQQQQPVMGQAFTVGQTAQLQGYTTGQTGQVQAFATGQTAQIQAFATGQTGQVGFPSLVPGTGVTQQSGVLNNSLSRQAFTPSPYHQSTLQQNAKLPLSTMLPSQQIHQNTSFTNYGAQSMSYVTPGQIGLQTAQPMTNTQVGGASTQLGGHMTGAQTYPPQQGVRGNLGPTPSHNKPGSGGWGMR